MTLIRRAAAFAAILCALPAVALAQQSDADLAQKLNNPVSNLTSVPFQYNYDCCFGPDRGNPSTLNIQPFVSWTSAKHTTFGVNTESSYDWRGGVWTVPVNFTVAQLYRVGRQAFQLTAGARAYAVTPEGGPGWGLRFVATLLFPT